MRVHAIPRLLATFVMILAFAAPARSAMVELSLIPSSTELSAGQDFSLEVWVLPGDESGGGFSLSSAEFYIVWDSPGISIDPDTAPQFGPMIDAYHDPLNYSFIEAVAEDKVHLSATVWNDVPVDDAGLLLATVYLTAGSSGGPIGFEFFMEGLGENTFWLEGAPLALEDVEATGAEVNVAVVPIPGALVLSISGLAMLITSRRTQRRASAKRRTCWGGMAR